MCGVWCGSLSVCVCGCACVRVLLYREDLASASSGVAAKGCAELSCATIASPLIGKGADIYTNTCSIYIYIYHALR